VLNSHPVVFRQGIPWCKVFFKPLKKASGRTPFINITEALKVPSTLQHVVMGTLSSLSLEVNSVKVCQNAGSL
jgi:hypothetical protein